MQLETINNNYYWLKHVLGKTIKFDGIFLRILLFWILPAVKEIIMYASIPILKLVINTDLVYWNSKTWSQEFILLFLYFQGHNHWILHIAWSPDGKKLASGCKNGEVRISNVLCKYFGMLFWCFSLVLQTSDLKFGGPHLLLLERKLINFMPFRWA